MVIVIDKTGKEISLKEWQHKYGLPENSTKIGKFFSTTERKFQQDLKDYGKLVVNEQLIRFLDRLREKWAKPITINSFNRSPEKQAQLTAAGYRTASFSPHMVFMAADVDSGSALESRQLAMLAEGVSKELGIKIRIGLEDYIKAGQTFVHFDVCPEYYAKGKPFHTEPHPIQWESAIKW
jgi:uncharacterized protein YcbK (DUF882 family)